MSLAAGFANNAKELGFIALAIRRARKYKINKLIVSGRANQSFPAMDFAARTREG